MAPAFRIAVAALALVASVFAAPLEERQTVSCADVMVIYARGTTEDAPIGNAISVGVYLRDNIRSRLGGRSLSFAGVDYPALISGYLVGGDPLGSRRMADYITNAASACPNAKIVSVGYSQGAQLVHNSAKMLSSAVTSRISAVVTFGDPYQHEAVGSVPSSKVLVVCHFADNICDGGVLAIGSHLTYQRDTPEAAQFIVSKV